MINKLKVTELIENCRAAHGSDIHIKAGQKFVYRVDGSLKTSTNSFSNEDIKELILSGEISLTSIQTHMIQSYQIGMPLNMDTTCTMDMNCRINIYSDLQGLNLAIRLLPKNIPTMKDLRLPPAIQNFTKLEHGLVVISGPTGSGKTTTIASILNEIAATQAKHIITIEQPIEYKISSALSLVTQREVGTHVLDFAEGLIEALRQDPDIILVGEMRDAETISTAMQAAETGHLVFTTLHAGNTMEAIDRFSQYFPADRNLEIRNQLANCLKAIVTQKLLPASETAPYNRVAAFEIMLVTDAIKNTIRSGKSFRLKDFMNRADGMITMEESIAGLKNRNLI